jgi:hypothetical protein
MLTRTIFIKNGNAAGTAFYVDRKGKSYLVTARHVASGVPERGAVLQWRQANEWVDLRTVRTLLPSNPSVDIAIFEMDQSVATPFEVTLTEGSEFIALGQQVWFLGFPFAGIGSPVRGGSPIGNDKDIVIPFIKRGTMSAMDGCQSTAVVLYIDGFNNRGFSGGPILYWSFGAKRYRILGVVEGYLNDRATSLQNGQQVDTDVLVNSGILIGYSIRHVLETIDSIGR